MDPLHFTVMVAPLGVYLLFIGLIGLRKHPFVTTGARDAAALGIGLCGVMVAGPMELFFPEGAAGRFGSWVWLLLIAFYGLCVSLFVLIMRPRIVIYNLGPERLRPILASVAMRLDPKARWAGDSLLLPTLEVHLNLEGSSWLANSQLVSVGLGQKIDGWRMIEKELREQLTQVESESVVFGSGLIAAAIALAAASVMMIVAQPEAVREALAEMLRL